MAAEKKSTLNLRGPTKKLFDSIRRRKKAIIILTLIREGADIDARNSKGYTPLLLASKYGLKTVVNLLIDSGAIVDSSECHFKRTLLHYASGYGWTDIVQSLVIRVQTLPSIVDRDCSVPCEESTFHAKDMEGRTALHLASLRGHLGVVKCLLEKGADFTTRNKCGGTALHEASSAGHLEVVKFLVGKEANLAARDEDGETALHRASGGGHVEVVKYLLDKGADMEAESSKRVTPLLVAFKCLSIDVIVLLINSGANVDCCDCNKRTVLHYASQMGWISMVQYLVQKDSVPPFTLDRGSIGSCEKSTCPTIHSRDMDGRTALHEASFRGHLDIVKLLVEKGANLNVMEKNGRTALHEASLLGELEVVKFLVEEGADINVKNCKGVAPLLLAAQFSQKDVVDLLVNSGANLDACDENKFTVLHYASRNGWPKIVQSLVGRMSNLDAKNNVGDTALLSACSAGLLNSIEYLLKAGARWDIRNKKGCLPFNLSKMVHPHVKFIELFIEAGAYITPVDYHTIENTYRLNKHFLQDVKFCCQAIINKFNGYDLPALYKLPVSSNLPRIEKMIVTSSSKVAQAIKQTVKLEIQTIGHCNIFEVRPMVLSLLSVRSILKYYNKEKPAFQKHLKRLAASDYKNEYHNSSKSMRLS